LSNTNNILEYGQARYAIPLCEGGLDWVKVEKTIYFIGVFQTGGEGGIRTPQFPADNKGNPHDDAQIDSQFPVASSPELSQVVTAWEKLPAPLKAAILAIIKSAE
jgi:hypothetical protein